MTLSSPRREEDMYAAKRQKIDEVLDQNGVNSLPVFRSLSGNYEEDGDDDDDDELLVIRRSGGLVKGKENHNSKENAKQHSSSLNAFDPALPKSSLAALEKSKQSVPASNAAVRSKGLAPMQMSKGTGLGQLAPCATKAANSVNKMPAKHMDSGSKSKSQLSGSTPSSSHSFPSTQENLLSDSRSWTATENVNGDDSDDDKPLFARFSGLRYTRLKKARKIMSPNEDAGIFGAALTNACQRGSKEMSDDSDDDKPLSHRLQLKPSATVPVINTGGTSDDSDGDKPLALIRPLKNGALMKGDDKEIPFKVYTKRRRPEQKASSLDAPASENLKGPVSQGSLTTRTELEENEDEDDIPLAKYIPAAANLNKSIIVKKASASSKTVIAVKKVLDARKAKLQERNKTMKGKKGAKSDKMAPGAGGGQKWTTLEHNGVIFPPPYKPHGVKMLYDGHPVDLTPEQEEVATMFAVMRDTEYVTKPKFLQNFWTDWKKFLGEDHVIKNLEKCDFTPIYNWHLAEKEKKKDMTSEEKKKLKEEKQKQEEKYMWALVDGVKEKVGNFRVEPPGLFRGRGDHPKMGKFKRRILPGDIIINIGKDAPIPECPMPDHRWNKIKHDNTVTWLAYWNDPINQKESKYVFLAASSTIKGQSDKTKYEKARLLKKYIENIRKTYTKNFHSEDPTVRQIAVATYLIDRLALRAGNEKDDDEADTVGCCSLKVEHVTLIPPRSLELDFLGKDSIRYFNTVEVVQPVYQAIGDFKKSKQNGQDLFDKLDTNKLNTHLKEIMPGLTAKVFRTYNASITLDTLIAKTDGVNVSEKVASYQRANKEVAILCNHQRSVSKSHGAQMEKLEGKMTELEALLEELRTELDRARKGKSPLKDADGKEKRNQAPEVLEKKITQTNQKIEKMKLDMQIKDDLKTVALGTSKINYMDPRITVAWCKRHEVPIEKVFNKSLLAKFAWAMDVDMDYRF